MRVERQMEYGYGNLPIPGGGYVTGIVFHEKVEGVLYCRTDIGGVYRFEGEKGRWKSLMDHVSMEDLSEGYPIAIGVDDNRAECLYIASGRWGSTEGVLSISEDYGESFRYERIPTMVFGNLNGRGTGKKLVVDSRDGNVLYFASQMGGVLRTRDRGETWERLSLGEEYTTFVWVSEDSKVIVVGTAGVSLREGEDKRGHSLYVSYDEGETFEMLMEPESRVVEGSRLQGLVASRYYYDGVYLYITMNANGPLGQVKELGYSCDSGDVVDGRVVRYEFEGGRIVGFKEITPGILEEGGEYLYYGFGGVSGCALKPGLLVCSTLCRDKLGGEFVYLSYDYGETWEISLFDFEIGGFHVKTPYMKREYNDNRSILHWITDIKINPFDKDQVWLNSGTGVFRTDGLTKENPAYYDCCDGIEETVHLNVYAPIDGEVLLVDILGDLGGFAFRELDKPCENTFADEEGNRYITCINADISDRNSNVAVITPRGNWRGRTKGGLIMTRDGFQTFKRLPMPFGLQEETDTLLHRIELPNVNSGWVAMSPDQNNILWSIANVRELPITSVVVSKDGGQTFKLAKVYDSSGRMAQTGLMKVFSDRCRDDIFYGFGEESQVYVSRDGGEHFYQVRVCSENEFPVVNFGVIDGSNKVEIRGESGKEGVFYMALGHHGLWKMEYQEDKNVVSMKRLTSKGEWVFRVGLGVGREGGNYVTEGKAIYFYGKVNNEFGFYRSLDDCQTCYKLNNDSQFFGEINSIDGDKRVFGRFFIGTGSRGVLYGYEK